MIVDNLLTFADGMVLDDTKASDVVDMGDGAMDDVNRPLHIVAHAVYEGADGVDASVAIAPIIEQSLDGGESWKVILRTEEVLIADAVMRGRNVIDFVKLPFGAMRGQLRVTFRVINGPIANVKVCAWLTPSLDVGHYYEAMACDVNVPSIHCTVDGSNRENVVTEGEIVTIYGRNLFFRKEDDEQGITFTVDGNGYSASLVGEPCETHVTVRIPKNLPAESGVLGIKTRCGSLDGTVCHSYIGVSIEHSDDDE